MLPGRYLPKFRLRRRHRGAPHGLGEPRPPARPRGRVDFSPLFSHPLPPRHDVHVLRVALQGLGLGATTGSPSSDRMKMHQIYRHAAWTRRPEARTRRVPASARSARGSHGSIQPRMRRRGEDAWRRRCRRAEVSLLLTSFKNEKHDGGRRHTAQGRLSRGQGV